MRMRRATWVGVTSCSGVDLRAAALACVLLVAGCRPAPEVGPEVPGGGAGEATTFTEIRLQILEPRCATSACHAGSPPVAEPRLDGPEAYDALVGAPSLQVPMNQVEPFDLANSYLVHKLRKTAGDVGGVASPMPIGDRELDEAEIAAIEAWILEGAPND